MSKIAMLYLLTTLTVLSAGMIESEIGINVGVNSTKNEDGNKFKNPTIGLSYQDNKYVISPRIDIDYTKVNDDYASSLIKVAVNGVYEYENTTGVIPYALVGVGYEHVIGGIDNVFESHPFVQGGIGARIDFDGGYKARLEGKMLQIVGSSNDEGNEAIITAGISFPLGYNKPIKKQRIVPRPIIVQPQPIIVESTPIIVQSEPIIMEPAPQIVYSNNNECSIKISLPDLDRDGIEDAIDQCPATPCSFTVDHYGCPVKATLKVNFATNSARIQDYSMHKVDTFANFLLSNRGSLVQIVGHTDSRGSSMKNAALSERRANSVMNALINKGVSSSRLSAVGRGEEMPLSSNKTADGRAMNRRIEAVLTYTGRR